MGLGLGLDAEPHLVRVRVRVRVRAGVRVRVRERVRSGAARLGKDLARLVTQTRAAHAEDRVGGKHEELARRAAPLQVAQVHPGHGCRGGCCEAGQRLVRVSVRVRVRARVRLRVRLRVRVRVRVRSWSVP